jgi:hypothetical protein
MSLRYPLPRHGSCVSSMCSIALRRPCWLKEMLQSNKISLPGYRGKKNHVPAPRTEPKTMYPGSNQHQCDTSVTPDFQSWRKFDVSLQILLGIRMPAKLTSRPSASLIFFSMSASLRIVHPCSSLWLMFARSCLCLGVHQGHPHRGS